MKMHDSMGDSVLVGACSPPLTAASVSMERPPGKVKKSAKSGHNISVLSQHNTSSSSNDLSSSTPSSSPPPPMHAQASNNPSHCSNLSFLQNNFQVSIPGAAYQDEAKSKHSQLSSQQQLFYPYHQTQQQQQPYDTLHQAHYSNYHHDYHQGQQFYDSEFSGQLYDRNRHFVNRSASGGYSTEPSGLGNPSASNSDWYGPQYQADTPSNNMNGLEAPNGLPIGAPNANGLLINNAANTSLFSNFYTTHNRSSIINYT